MANILNQEFCLFLLANQEMEDRDDKTSGGEPSNLKKARDITPHLKLPSYRALTFFGTEYHYFN